nr:PREDICTED: CCA tRNA nucleotidyltransferase 1, mitochondrial isoform X2 [Bemisia tabaci]
MKKEIPREIFDSSAAWCIRRKHQFIPAKYLKSQAEARKEPAIMKLDTPEFHSIFTPELEKLVSIFNKHSYEIRIAGGAVRDLLMGKAPHDLDFATVATPDEMKSMFITENIRMINNRGEKHGTITARINDKANFEVTTLRIDISTDGRHAEVQFTTDWKLDANRRDLTINAMFLGLDGTVYDYFYGYEDLQKRRVRFVGDAVQRIQEDYLRMLRYFRFYGRIAEHPDAHDGPTLEAMRQNASGLDRISGERIWAELSKILEGNFGGELMAKMLSLGMGPHMGFPKDSNVDEFMRIWNQSKNIKLKPPSLIAALVSSIDEVTELYGRLKFSALERDLCYFIVEHRGAPEAVNRLRPYQLLELHSRFKPNVAHDFVIELLKYKNDLELLKEFEPWRCPKFPVNGIILRENGVPGGPSMGIAMSKLKAYWADHDFKATAEDIIKQIPRILDEMGVDPSAEPQKKPSPKKSRKS